MKLDHIGIAVKSISEARGFYEAGLRLQSEPQIEEVAGEKVRVQKLELPPGAHIELIEATTADSTIAKFIEKRGPGLHHLCYEVQDIAAETKRMKQAGFTPIWDEPHLGAGGCLVNFFHPRETHGVLTELSQRPN
jgi:methylmalonyl-CoA/ethylmalonyl-CoA epimerase